MARSARSRSTRCDGFLALAFVLPLGLGSTANADPRPGTHLLAEVRGGAVAHDGGGLSLGALFGAGGKIPGFPPRFYVISEIAYSASSAQGLTATASALAYEDHRRYVDLGAGLRVYVPIFHPVRLFADALVGTTNVSSELQRSGLLSHQAEGWLPLVAFGGGVQVRLAYELSVGIRARAVITSDDIGGTRAMVGQTSPTRVSTTASLTWHF